MCTHLPQWEFSVGIAFKPSPLVWSPTLFCHPAVAGVLGLGMHPWFLHSRRKLLSSPPWLLCHPRSQTLSGRLQDWVPQLGALTAFSQFLDLQTQALHSSFLSHLGQLLISELPARMETMLAQVFLLS